ncbi:MAG: glycosyltransferase [Verrucomicrobiota bacterium]
MLTKELLESEFSRKWRARLDFAPLRLYPRKKIFSAWSNDWRATGFVEEINRSGADIVHLHWIGHGVMSLGEVGRIQAPVIWTMHDAWSFTGGCHYPGACRHFAGGCGACPQLGSRNVRDLSRWNFDRKRMHFTKVRRWITPSRWLGEMARGSPVIDSARLSVVPNCVDLDLYVPTRRTAARRRLGLADDMMVFTCGSLDLGEPRKGNQLLPRALAEWRRLCPETKAELLMFGTGGVPRLEVPGLSVRAMGSIAEPDAMADMLAAGDVLILPSLQDNLPNVAVEAQACGSPVVGFDSGGLSEIIEPGRTGWLAEELTAEALGRAMAVSTTQAKAERPEWSRESRSRAERLFAPARHGKMLRGIYEEVLRER